MSAVEGRPARRIADGLRVLADLRYRPPGLARDAGAHLLDAYVPASGTGPWPLVVYAHGGGLSAGDKDDETRVNRNISIALAQRGFVVLNINHRLVDEAPHPAQAEDVAAAVPGGASTTPRSGRPIPTALSWQASLPGVTWQRCWSQSRDSSKRSRSIPDECARSPRCRASSTSITWPSP
jgi:hypothetical protein